MNDLQRSGQRVSLCTVGSGEKKYAGLIVVKPAENRIISRFPQSAAIAKPFPMAFPNVERWGSHAVELLSSAEMPAKSCDHLIENEDCALLLAEVLQFAEKARRGRRNRLRLKYDARDPPRIFVEKLF